jgi:DNA-binding HxlR family transcriptional regulator
MGSHAKNSGPCAIHGLLEVLARPWAMHILWTLSTNGPTRFGALRRQDEGISSRVLTERPRGLEQKGIVYREYEPTIPPAVTYGITKRMKEIKQVLGELNRLAETWQNEDGHNRTRHGLNPDQGGLRKFIPPNRPGFSSLLTSELHSAGRGRAPAATPTVILSGENGPACESVHAVERPAVCPCQPCRRPKQVPRLRGSLASERSRCARDDRFT